MLEKVSVIPYAIRQFCKCLYQMTITRFKINYEQAIKVVAHYLLDDWLLKAVFTNLHVEGLVKEFYLGPFCKKNLQLTKHILLSIMTFTEWEVPTPQNERHFSPGEVNRDLFTIDANKKKK